jgi:protein-disulfide isomerase
VGCPVISNFIASVSAWISKTDKRVLAGGGLAALLVVGGGAWYLLSSSPADIEAAAEGGVSEECVATKEVTLRPDDFIIGDKDAPVVLVEYLSQTCSHCAEYKATILPKLEETFVKTGKLKIVLRELHRNPIDIAASVIGRCMGRDSFIPFTNMLLENQATWLGREDQNIEAGLKEMARRAGLQGADFDACIKDPKSKDLGMKLAKRTQCDAENHEITATPTLFLNGTRLQGAETAFASLDTKIREALKKAGVAEPPAAAAETPAAGEAGEAAPAAEGAPAAEATPEKPAEAAPPQP